MAHHTITENGNTVNCYEYSIKNEDEYKVVLSAIEKLMEIDPPAGSVPGDILLWLSYSAQEFESRQETTTGENP
jgi:antitoxin component HigA of HigAB toxin-antitoxin module